MSRLKQETDSVPSKIPAAVIWLAWLFAVFPAHAVEFASVFGDRMVLQRNQPVEIWGQGTPRETVAVTLADVTRPAEVDASGRWRARFPAMKAGGPYRIELRDESGGGRLLEDVLVGDVWLCSGQSNMEWPVARASGGAEELLSQESIRMLTIQHDSAVVPQQELSSIPQWLIAEPDSIRDFSAVCYFFAMDLQAANGVPLGLVHSSWGGSRIEAWISARGLQEVGGYAEQLDLLSAYASDPRQAAARFGDVWEDWWRSVSARDEPWATKDAKGWKTSPERMQDWKSFGDTDLAEHNGMVWYRNSVELTKELAKQDGLLLLGGIDEVDATWINGVFTGSQFGWGTERRYQVPEGILRPGANDITVNVLSTWGSGGMLGPNERVVLTLGNGERRSLGKGWEYRKVPAKYGSPPRAPWEPIAGLTGLYNAMIAPLQDLRFAGTLWYQGESNAGDAEHYEKLLRAFTADWRNTFGESLPFLIVQLPNFGPPPVAPSDSGWARIRDAQRRVAKDDANTGLVVTIDTGDSFDLHPPNKRIVGQRAAKVARAMIFDDNDNENGVVDGLSPARATRHGNEIVVHFEPAANPLRVAGDERPVAFELCGNGERGCVYAGSRLEGNRVHLFAPAMQYPTRVRHCWADAPLCNLYGAGGLPVGSFEIEIEP